MEFSKSAFTELVQTLLKNESEKNKYFKVSFTPTQGLPFIYAFTFYVCPGIDLYIYLFFSVKGGLLSTVWTSL